MFSPPLSPVDTPKFGPRGDSLADIPALDSIDGCLAQAAFTSPTEKSTSQPREEWLSGGRGRKGLRIVIVTENFLPKVDGVTRTLARLLEHLDQNGHSCMVLGPNSGMSHYSGHPLVGTLGLPLMIYPGLKLNFLRPRFMSCIKAFRPDVVHFVDPIWLGAQTMMAMELGWAGEEWVGPSGPKLGGGFSGAVVASYHTNLATYATLFGMPRLEPLMWRFQKWLYNKTILTLCPSPSTTAMLETQNIHNVRLWPRGVDLTYLNPSKRSAALRAQWGMVDDLRKAEQKPAVIRRASLPITPPTTPLVRAIDADIINDSTSAPPRRMVAMYTGRVSWEKNLHLLLLAFEHLGQYLPEGVPTPKLVVVGDGPARQELERLCAEKAIDATFMGHRSGEDLAACYASADVFVFPSFTETFGQVILESQACGVPLVGLDADGTRDLVQDNISGRLLPLPQKTDAKGVKCTWPRLCKVSTKPSPDFDSLARDYAKLIAELVSDEEKVKRMGTYACTQSIKGYTWWDAMERCVDGYREAMRTAIERRAADSKNHGKRSLSGLRRPFSAALAHRGEWKQDVFAPVKFVQFSSFGVGLMGNAAVFLVLYLIWRYLHQ